MASREGGKRPVGTDGSDFMHREKIATQYSTSAEAKRLVKYSIYMHIMMSVLVMVQLAFHFGAKLSENSSLPEVPKPMLWEYIWLTSIVPAVVGYFSLNKNRLKLLRFYYLGTVVLGLGVVLSTMLFNASDLWDYAKTKQTTNLYYDFPVIVLWYIYLFIVIQIHAFGVYFARVLIRIWSLEANKKRK